MTGPRVHTVSAPAQGTALQAPTPSRDESEAGGTAWLGILPAEKGTPSLPRKRKRGKSLGQSGEGNEFQFQTAFTFGRGLPNRLVFLKACMGGACLRGKG